jgi:succinoglycan biosynthesis protein ExoH
MSGKKDHLGVFERINSLRLLLILGIMVIHIPFDDSTAPYGTNSFINWLRIVLGDLMFQAGVPCFSAISGFLLFRNGPDVDFRKMLRSKWRSIVVPFLIWNLGFYACVYVAQAHGAGYGYLTDLHTAGPAVQANMLFAAAGKPINLPLYFLRDLFVCMLISPLIAKAVLRAPAFTLVVLFALSQLCGNLGLLLRADVLFAFALGAAVALRGWDAKALDRFNWIILPVFVAAASGIAVQVMQKLPESEALLGPERKLLLIIGMVAFWTGGALITGPRLKEKLAAGSRYSFWLYCAHCPVFIVLWMVWNRFLVHHNYLWFYAGAYLITVAALIAVYTIGYRIAPKLILMLSGGR